MVGRRSNPATAYNSPPNSSFRFRVMTIQNHTTQAEILQELSRRETVSRLDSTIKPFTMNVKDVVEMHGTMSITQTQTVWAGSLAPAERPNFRYRLTAI